MRILNLLTQLQGSINKVTNFIFLTHHIVSVNPPSGVSVVPVI